jgi:hypothetical protein
VTSRGPHPGRSAAGVPRPRSPGVRSVPGLVALLLVHLLAVGYLTLRPSRILFRCRGGVLATSDPDWNLFLVHDQVRWDGHGRLQLTGTMRAEDPAAGVGLLPLLTGSKGRERALIAGLRPQAEGLFVRWHDAPASPGTLPGWRPELVELRAEAWREAGRVHVRAELADARAVMQSVPDAGIEWPVRVGLWASRPGCREFTSLRIAIDGRELVRVCFDRPDALGGFTPVVGDVPEPFSLSHAPFFRANRYGVWNTLRQDGLDVFNNLLLLAPTGVFLALLVRRRPVLSATLVCLLLSLSVELLQLAVPTRVTSLYDLLCNTVGGGLAAWLTARAWPRCRG